MLYFYIYMCNEEYIFVSSGVSPWVPVRTLLGSLNSVPTVKPDKTKLEVPLQLGSQQVLASTGLLVGGPSFAGDSSFAMKGLMHACLPYRM